MDTLTRYLFKYRNQTAVGPITYFCKLNEPCGFLSQWYATSFESEDFPDISFPTLEHFIQYNKATLFGDDKLAKEILALPASQPIMVISAGERVKGFKSTVWHKCRDGILFSGICSKFLDPRNADILQKLLRLKDQFLVNCDANDHIWGIGCTPEQARSTDTPNWGENRLGIFLMAFRDDMLADEARQTTDGKEPSQPSQPSSSGSDTESEGRKEKINCSGNDNDNASLRDHDEPLLIGEGKSLGAAGTSTEQASTKPRTTKDGNNDKEDGCEHDDDPSDSDDTEPLDLVTGDRAAAKPDITDSRTVDEKHHGSNDDEVPGQSGDGSGESHEDAEGTSTRDKSSPRVSVKLHLDTGTSSTELSFELGGGIMASAKDEEHAMTANFSVDLDTDGEDPLVSRAPTTITIGIKRGLKRKKPVDFKP